MRRYVREFAPSETVHPSLAFNECAQLNAIAAPTGRVQCYVTDESNLEWRLERDGAPLRSWKISLTGVTLLLSPWTSPGISANLGTLPFGRPFRESDIAKRVTFQVRLPEGPFRSRAFQVKSATPTGREMGAANLEDGTSITALLVSDHLEHRGTDYLNKRRIQRVLN